MITRDPLIWNLDGSFNEDGFVSLLQLAEQELRNKPRPLPMYPIYSSRLQRIGEYVISAYHLSELRKGRMVRFHLPNDLAFVGADPAPPIAEMAYKVANVEAYFVGTAAEGTFYAKCVSAQDDDVMVRILQRRMFG